MSRKARIENLLASTFQTEHQLKCCILLCLPIHLDATRRSCIFACVCLFVYLSVCFPLSVCLPTCPIKMKLVDIVCVHVSVCLFSSQCLSAYLPYQGETRRYHIRAWLFLSVFILCPSAYLPHQGETRRYRIKCIWLVCLFFSQWFSVLSVYLYFS